MSGNDKPRINLLDMQARLARNRDMLQKNCSPTKKSFKKLFKKTMKITSKCQI